jgi:hypothetical protein
MYTRGFVNRRVGFGSAGWSLLLGLVMAGGLWPQSAHAQPMMMPGMEGAMEGQPPAATSVRRLPSGSQQLAYRLARVPKMFGDLIAPGGHIEFLDDSQGISFTSAIPSAAAFRRSKIAENNNPLPQNRIYFMYNHFHNAQAIVFNEPFTGDFVQRDSHFDQYTFGVEKMIFNDTASLELRVPWNSSFDFTRESFTLDGGNVGNLALIYKQLIYWEDTFAIGLGSSVEFPTGSSVKLRIINRDTELLLENDAVRFLPFVGVVSSPSEELFWQFTAQVDLATGGNRVLVNGSSEGRFNDQNLLYLDMSVGRWLFMDEEASWLTGVAGMLELHYVTSIQDSDILDIPSRLIMLQNFNNRFDVFNLTAGINCLIGSMTNLRIAAVAPLDQERFFDSEFQIQLNRWY